MFQALTKTSEPPCKKSPQENVILHNLHRLRTSIAISKCGRSLNSTRSRLIARIFICTDYDFEQLIETATVSRAFLSVGIIKKALFCF